MTIRVEIHVPHTEPHAVEVHPMYVGKYPPSRRKIIVEPGRMVAMYVSPGSEILVRQPEPEDE